MIYVDVSQLSQWLARGRHLTGIQRLTYNCVAGLFSVVGSDRLRVMVYDPASKGFKAARAEYLLGAKSNVRSFEIPKFEAGDQILLTEWIFSPRISAAHFELAKHVEARIFQFVHDCIPLARPDLLRKYLVQDFRRKMGEAISHADVVLTNSEHSKKDILRFFPRELGKKDVRVVKLAHEFASNEMGLVAKQTPHEAAITDKLLQTLAAKPFVLMVGTLEERKNTHLAIQFWRQLLQRHGTSTPTLVLVGDYSWHKIDLTFSLLVGRFFWRSVRHLRNCDDATLVQLYKKSLFTIYLSSYEGWGLPVGESMWFGTPVLSSNATALPEVGLDLIDYVDPNDSDALGAAVERLSFDEAYRRRRAENLKSAKLRNWHDFAVELAAAVGNL